MLLKTRGSLLRSAPTWLGQASGRVGPCVPTRSGHGRFFGDAWANRSRDVLSPTAFVRDGRIENITNNKNRKKASIMAKFMCTHTLPPGKFSADQLRQFAQAAQMDPNVKGYRSFANLAEGKAVCIMEAPGKDAVAAWFTKMGMPFDSITKVELEGERGSIQPA